MMTSLTPFDIVRTLASGTAFIPLHTSHREAQIEGVYTLFQLLEHIHDPIFSLSHAGDNGLIARIVYFISNIISDCELFLEGTAFALSGKSHTSLMVLVIEALKFSCRLVLMSTSPIPTVLCWGKSNRSHNFPFMNIQSYLLYYKLAFSKELYHLHKEQRMLFKTIRPQLGSSAFQHNAGRTETNLIERFEIYHGRRSGIQLGASSPQVGKNMPTKLVQPISAKELSCSGASGSRCNNESSNVENWEQSEVSHALQEIKLNEVLQNVKISHNCDAGILANENAKCKSVNIASNSVDSSFDCEMVFTSIYPAVQPFESEKKMLLSGDNDQDKFTFVGENEYFKSSLLGLKCKRSPPIAFSQLFHDWEYICEWYRKRVEDILNAREYLEGKLGAVLSISLEEFFVLGEMLYMTRPLIYAAILNLNDQELIEQVDSVVMLPFTNVAVFTSLVLELLSIHLLRVALAKSRDVARDDCFRSEISQYIHVDNRLLNGQGGSRFYSPPYVALRKRVYDAYLLKLHNIAPDHYLDKELVRRQWALVLYLVRSPIFDRLTFPTVEYLSYVVRGIPLLESLTNQLLDALKYLNKMHFCSANS